MKNFKAYRTNALIIGLIVASGFIWKIKSGEPLVTHVLSQPKPSLENWGSLFLYTPDSSLILKYLPV